MPKLLRLTLTEIIWLVIAAIVTILICKLFFYIDTRHWTADVHIHDTYFVLSLWHLLIVTFFLATFLIFFIKEAFKKYSRTLPIYILLVTGVVLIGLLTILNKELIKMGTTLDVTGYPPLSNLSDSLPKAQLDPTIGIISNAMTLLQLILTVFLLIICFFWGRNRQSG